MAKSRLQSSEEEPQKAYRQILFDELSSGLAEYRRPSFGLLLSSLSGGLDVSISVLLMALMRTRLQGEFPDVVIDLAAANMYAVGFVFVVIGRSELFTEHTSRAIFPVLSGHASWTELARLWTLVYVGNLLGIVAFAGLLAWIGPSLGIDSAAFSQMARPLVERTWWFAIISAALAGWLMGLMAWLVSACRDTISQIVIVWIVACVIGLTVLPHAIVGSGEVLADIFSGQGTTLVEYLHFLALTTLGNGIGGTVFVAALKYSHSTRGADARPGSPAASPSSLESV